MTCNVLMGMLNPAHSLQPCTVWRLYCVNRLVSGSYDTTLHVWDIMSGHCLHVLIGHVGAVCCVQYDGRRVVSGACDYMVKIWDPESETCLQTLSGYTIRDYSLQVHSAVKSDFWQLRRYKIINCFFCVTFGFCFTGPLFLSTPGYSESHTGLPKENLWEL